jgi:glycosyltransferase involved in cell wall biosynthesis
MPTEKAYGVTILNTAKALIKHGTETEIWSVTESSQVTKPLRPFELSQDYVSGLRRGFSSRYKSTRFLAYFVNVLKISEQSKARLTKEDCSLVILREPILLMLIQGFLRKSNHCYLLELHHIPNKGVRILVNAWRRYRFFEIATISSALDAKAKKLISPSPKLLLPMAAPEHFRDCESEPSDSESFVYYGKLKSSGNDNGILGMLKTIKNSNDLNRTLKFTLVGFNGEEKREIEDELGSLANSRLSLAIEPHVENEKLPLVLSKFFASIIPYPNSGYNNERFPLKLVELAALGMPLIVSNIKGLQNLLPEDSVIWYSSEDPDSLIRAIKTLMEESQIDRQERINRLKDWSQIYSYENRAKLIQMYSKSMEVHA